MAYYIGKGNIGRINILASTDWGAKYFCPCCCQGDKITHKHVLYCLINQSVLHTIISTDEIYLSQTNNSLSAARIFPCGGGGGGGDLIPGQFIASVAAEQGHVSVGPVYSPSPRDRDPSLPPFSASKHHRGEGKRSSIMMSR